MIGIVDYGMGNLGSVKRSFDRMGVSSVVSRDYLELGRCQKLILPGVGHFGAAVEQLKRTHLWDFLRERVEVKQTPILGICLGMQLMAKCSEEGDVDGFGWFDVEVSRFKVSDTLRFKIPHIGWNSLSVNSDNPLLCQIAEDDEFYFVHSYHLVSKGRDFEIATSRYDYNFVSVIGSGVVFGVQFHPEKSHRKGEVILRNFANI